MWEPFLIRLTVPNNSALARLLKKTYYEMAHAKNLGKLVFIRA